MERLIWVLSELGPLIWFGPAFLFLALTAWRGGYLLASLGLGCLLTGSVFLTVPEIGSAPPLNLLHHSWSQALVLVASVFTLRLILPRVLSSEH